MKRPAIIRAFVSSWRIHKIAGRPPGRVLTQSTRRSAESTEDDVFSASSALSARTGFPGRPGGSKEEAPGVRGKRRIRRRYRGTTCPSCRRGGAGAHVGANNFNAKRL